MTPEFPSWVRLAHASNLLFIGLLMRSGLEILAAHPKLYWNDDARPGSEWLKLGGAPIPADAPWTAEDEAIALPSWLALPGGRNLGLGRHWHFWSVLGWVATGLIYVVGLFVSGAWTRLIPTSWAIVPRAWHDLGTYAHFGLPPEGTPFNALQQLTYAAVVFVLAPLLIASGLGMSTALAGRFPAINRWLGGHQGARSVHFLGLLAFVAFTLVHTAMVVAHGFPAEMSKIVLGTPGRHQALATVIGAIGLAGVLAWHVLATRYSLVAPQRVKRLLELGVEPVLRWLFHGRVSRQAFARRSAVFRVNGRPPHDPTWQQLAAGGFAEWRLGIGGLVESPCALSLAELRALPSTSLTSRHVCIQGWTAFAQWRGVGLGEILARVRPLPEARYLVFHTYDDKWEHPGHGSYYEVLDLAIADRPQTILAYEMNDEPLPVAHGAPLRLRCEGQLGYKMAKWLRAIEFVADYRAIGGGQGGWREDVQHYYPGEAGI